jgi:hypothetical protein
MDYILLNNNNMNYTSARTHINTKSKPLQNLKESLKQEVSNLIPSKNMKQNHVQRHNLMTSIKKGGRDKNKKTQSNIKHHKHERFNRIKNLILKNSTVINNEFTSHQTRTGHSNQLSPIQSPQILWTSQPVQNLKEPDSLNTGYAIDSSYSCASSVRRTAFIPCNGNATGPF